MDTRGLETPESESEYPVVVCTECQSQNVRRSHSSYPLDQSKVAGNEASFWRCDNCGLRFLGPFAGERKHRHHGRAEARHRNDELSRKVRLNRVLKRWLFPALVILATIIAVIYILDRRNNEPHLPVENFGS